MKKTMFYVFFILLLFCGAVFAYFFIGNAQVPQKIVWGVNFSQRHATNLGLNWKETYQALLEDERVKRLKIGADWDLLGPAKGVFQFNDLDWQIQQAQEHEASILLAVGMKTPRWPECHIPDWAKSLPKADQQKEILAMLQQVVERYKNSPTIWGWQVENEPFFRFGTCPWNDDNFLQQEVALVHSLDQTRPVVLTDTGEFSFWTKPARYGDIVGTTLYRKVWFSPLLRYFTYPFQPVFYWRKAQLVRWLFGKDVIGVELQAEPWGPGKLIYDTPLSEQEKTMNLEQFRNNIDYAKKTGLSTQYLWGAEWWYWMKTKQNDPSIWNEAKQLFSKTY